MDRLKNQIESVDKSTLHKQHKGISFVRLINNTIEYINIPNAPGQTFRYFYNPSKLSKEEREKIKNKVEVFIKYSMFNQIKLG